MRVHGGDDCCDCGDGGRGGGDYVVAAPERRPPQKRPKACYRAVDHAQCQEHKNQMNLVVALQPERVQLVHGRLECWTCHAPSGHDYDIRRTVKNGKTGLA